MASLTGFRFNITGATGSQGALGPKQSWRAYVFPRGGYASQDSSGTLITFDTADVASRFAANNWIQVGLSTANIRKVSVVAGNSLSVSGSAVTVSENDRVFLIGNTQPTVTGGSATYTTPNTLVRERDDDTADLISNSMITSDSDGMVQGFCAPNYYDVLIQDGDQSNQSSVIDLPVGAVDGVSVSGAALFGDTVTVNGALGVTGWATFGSTVTMNAAMGVTGWATFGASVTVTGAVGITGTLVVGQTTTFGASVSMSEALAVDGPVGVTGNLTVTGNVGVTGSITGAGQPQCRMRSNTISIQVPDSTFTDLWFQDEVFDVGGMITPIGASYSQIAIQEAGIYVVTGSISWLANAAGLRELAIFNAGSATRESSVIGVSGEPYQVRQTVTTIINAVAGNTITLVGRQTSGGVRTAGIGDFSAVKVC